MLALTKKVGYGLIAMTHLARAPEGELYSARKIAEMFGVPTSLLMNILKELATEGLVRSVRGAKGGYCLARDPSEISLADVITALEGPIKLAECVTGELSADSHNLCSIMASCPVADPVHRVHRKIYDYMNQLTLAEIAEPSPAEIVGQT